MLLKLCFLFDDNSTLTPGIKAEAKTVLIAATMQGWLTCGGPGPGNG